VRRGEVWWADFDPSVGSEIKKRRPAIIVSANASNLRLGRVQVVPTTTGGVRNYPGQSLVTVGDRRSRALADQIRTLDKSRLVDRIGMLSDDDLRRVECAIKTQLAL
jgi:mRNA interferase MazF